MLACSVRSWWVFRLAKKMRAIYQVTLFLALSGAVWADEWKPVELLNGRLLVSMPAGSAIGAREHKVTEARKSSEEETRVVSVDGLNKLVLVARELFAVAGPDYNAQVLEALRTQFASEQTAFKVERIGQHVIAGRASDPNAADDAILYATCFVRHRDDSIQRLGLYFNPKFHENPENCRSLTDRILASVRLGPRQLDLASGTRRLDARSDKFDLSVALPDGWLVTSQYGLDFVVHKLSEVAAFGTRGKTIGIYMGGRPGYQWHKLGATAKYRATRSSAFLGGEQEWVTYSTTRPEVWRHVETIRGIPKPDASWKVHVFAAAPSDSGVDEILAILRSALVTEKTQPAR